MDPTSPAPLAGRDALDDTLDTVEMGERVRTLRLRAGWSTSELAVRAGLSAGVISQIERGLGNPSLKTLERLRVSLGVSLMTLIEGTPARGDDPSFVRRLGARPHLTVGPLAVDKAILSPAGTEGLRLLLVTLPIGARIDEMIREDGQKAGLVLRGRVRLVVDHESCILTEGDSFQFSAALPHVLWNDGPRPAEIVWIMAGPAFATPA